MDPLRHLIPAPGYPYTHTHTPHTAVSTHTYGPFTKGWILFFLKLHIFETAPRERVFMGPKKKKSETPEMTKNDVIPMPGLVWHCMFTPWRQKKNIKKRRTSNVGTFPTAVGFFSGILETDVEVRVVPQQSLFNRRCCRTYAAPQITKCSRGGSRSMCASRIYSQDQSGEETLSNCIHCKQVQILNYANDDIIWPKNIVLYSDVYRIGILNQLYGDMKYWSYQPALC